ncbi:hypothetical protein GCM10010082_22360 [Kushneria pakistanensis]|uniref:Energy transducer TonB n=1 Tax=Kushneria pakistanensis TaxID=1508770 RepID=A0ABQ3FL97_9GAMM|nr:hypothetical protein [Kushneria pakistanensis]GHC28482.1 hypothetical protein GCM10010082_22360 [Kushneria pakistanensis]
MVTERARRQYLDAMGINLWVARHPLPNALASFLPALEEAPDSPDEALNHHQRLHALIDDIDHPESAPQGPMPERPVPAPEATPRDPSAHARSIRALLGTDTDEAAVRPAVPTAQPPSEPTPQVEPETNVAPEAAVPRAHHEPLRFSLQVAALDGRWLVLLTRDEALNAQEETLLNAILQAGGVQPSAPLSCQRFGWPMMEGLPVDDALDEARQGFKAFLAGRRARGWRPERILLFGRLSALDEVLDIQDGQSRVLGLPLWQGPSIESLKEAPARRALWAIMGEWQTWWQATAPAGEAQ